MLRNIATDSARINDLQTQLELIWIAADAVRADAALQFSRHGKSLSVSVHGMRRQVHQPPRPVPTVSKPGVGVTSGGQEYCGCQAGSDVPGMTTTCEPERPRTSTPLQGAWARTVSSTLLS